MNPEEPFNYERYTEENLYRDIEILRKAGVIQVEGITDDGQWLYGMTEEGKSLIGDTDGINYDVLAKVFENIERIIEEDE